MADLNWIDKNERLPTKEDTNKDGQVYALENGTVCVFHQSNDMRLEYWNVTHWLPFREMPIPKGWRTPTIHDLAKAGKPIPCRVRDTIAQHWNKGMLCAIDVQTDIVGRPFMSNCGNWYYLCEIEE